MSWAAMNYVRRLKRETGIVGNVRFVLLMIAWRIPKGYIESRPIPLRWLVNDTALDRKTVRECIKKAVGSGQVRIGKAGRGRGNFSTYVMPNLAGPLFMVDGAAPEKGGDSPPFLDEEKGGESPPIAARRKGGDLPPFVAEKGEIRPGSVRTSSLRDVRTKKTTTTSAKPVAAALYVTALEYLDWFSAAYSEHHKGARMTVDVEVDGPVVVRLLTSPARTVGLLKSMTLVMWTATVEEDAWVARATDRGLRLLNHAADRLERIALARQAPPVQRLAECHYKHTPPCSSRTACAQRERELVAERDRDEATG